MSAASGMRTTGLTLMLALAAQAHAAEPRIPHDGWVSWDVPAVQGAPAWCCFDGMKGRDNPEACRLDDRNFSFGTRDNEKMSMARVYARSSGGKVDRLQVLSPVCPVITQSPVQQLNEISADESARWLAAQLRLSIEGGGAEETQAERVVPALALHRGAVAQAALVAMARHEYPFELRKRVVFWMAMIRGAEGADFVSSTMFGDAEPEMRRHAAFALSQSKSPRIAADLIKLGKADKVGDVRAKAWFWLAQTGAAEADRAIDEAVRKDPDGEVREEAIFALSLLPDERATRALIAAAEDQSLSREQRKRAVFWLSQSRSESAVAYLDRVLAGLSLP